MGFTDGFLIHGPNLSLSLVARGADGVDAAGPQSPLDVDRGLAALSQQPFTPSGQMFIFNGESN